MYFADKLLYSPPPKKIRRMHIGLTQQSIGLPSATMVKSVGQRLKDASYRGKEYGNGITIATNGVSNGVCTKNSSKQHFVAERGTLHVHQPIILSELQKNTVRVIGQYLRELGMNDTVNALLEESGCRIENPLSMKLRDSIQRGHWQKALEIIEKLRSQLAEKQYLAVKVLLLEEKFKEFMQKGEYLMALRLLQIEYPKSKELRPRHEHWATILCTQAFSGQQYNDKWEIGDSTTNVLNVLRKVLPPSLMLPPNRLQELLKQSWLYQTKQCDFHGLSREQNIVDDRAILIDHQCSNREFPSKTTSTLYTNAEVWFLKFSPCGRFLASGAKGTQVQIWRMDSPVEMYQNIQINQDIIGVASISWSHDSLYLAVCGTEQANGTGCFIYYVPSGRLVKEYGSAHYAGDSFTSVSFFKDKSHKLACAGQKGHFHVYDIHRPEDNAKIFEGFRIRCLYACKDGRSVLAADTHNRIRKYDFENQREETLIQEASQIMFFTVDKEERYCLVTTKTEGIRLWCLKTITLIRTFFGANHTDFVITSSFGGPDNSFIAAGSEDNSVIIWNLRRSHPIKKLLGHTSTVNCVAWNPVNPRIIASGSDDGTIRIWSTTMDMN